MTEKILGQRYRLLAPLGAGGMGMVFRAHDEHTGRQVALKQVTVANERLEFGSRAIEQDFALALAREFSTLSSMRHPHIISVLDYGFDEAHRPYFTMDLLEGGRSFIEYGRKQAFAEQVNLALQLLHALAYLHRRDVIHRDLKPDNALIVDGQVRVLDFGLAVAREQVRAGGHTLSGTIGYMAPEILQGDPAGVASDLYAVGVMLYELFVGRHPFALDNPNLFWGQVFTDAPDVTGAPEPLQALLTVLLEKAPEARPASAQAVIAQLAELVGHAPEHEQASYQESFLRGARFTGREQELALLDDALPCTPGARGSAWLIAGQSGAGKSRLLGEVRTFALVNETLVLRGQAVSAGGQPYRVWLNILRRLCLHTPLDDLEASVLQPLVPDIERRIGRLIMTPAPELNPADTQVRLFDVIERVFSRQTRPMLIVLEDLHWAGTESIALLARLVVDVAGHPFMFAASYRDDERPDLPERLAEMRTLALSPLQAGAIELLVTSMLGARRMSADQIAILVRGTEGNPFFLIEVVRWLASMPETQWAARVAEAADALGHGGDWLVARRLEQVAAADLPLLRLAAVAGGQIDLPLLRALDPTGDLEAWLERCSDVAILDVADERWRFAHDRMRQGVLAGLTPEMCARLHAQVATGLETAYPEQARSVLSASLAHHWREAGVPEREAKYVDVAGESALRNGAYREALMYFERALALRPEAPERIVWHRQSAQAYAGLGDLPQAIQYYRRALVLCGFVDPQPSARYTADLVAALLQQVLRRFVPVLRPRKPLPLTDQAAAHYHEALLIYTEMGPLAFFVNDPALLIYSEVRHLNMSEEIRAVQEMARSYAGMCIVAAVVPAHGLGRFYRAEALRLAQDVNDPVILGYMYSRVTVYSTGSGELVRGLAEAREAERLLEQAGSLVDLGLTLISVGAALRLLGRFDESHAVYVRLVALSKRNHELNHRVWGLTGQATALFAQRAFAEAVHVGEEAVATAQVEPATRVNQYGALAGSYWGLGEVESARKYAEEALAMLDKLGRPTVYTTYEGLFPTLETLIALWHAASEPGTRERLRQLVRRALAHGRTYSGIFPIGWPALWRSQGSFHWVSGERRAAEAAWTRALAEARRLEMAHEVAETERVRAAWRGV